MSVDIQVEIVKRELKMGARVTKIICNLRDLQDDQKILGKVCSSLYTIKLVEHRALENSV